MTAILQAGPTGDATKPKLSVVVPVYNEQENIPVLYERLNATLRELGNDYEIILVNDGSRDGSLVALRRLAAEHPEVKVLDLQRNSGQTAALMCGIDHSTGDIIIPIDADLQNDPADIPRLLEKLAEGYDVVSGWRRDRKDAAIRRNLVSRAANRVISKISGVHLQDYGCSLKAYRRSVLDGVRLYGEMHRFVPIYASWMGAKIAEIPVSHSPRIYGKSSYGLERIAKVILDLIVVKFLDRHLVKPIYIFGGFGLLSIAVSFLALFWALYLKLVDGLSLIQTPLPLLSAMALLAGITAILLGLMSEILVRTYFESQDKRPYYVRERLNL
ncbi:MAG TPA: glycosyltransferase family 2 protein [Terriglobia bacterium]|nr:glycosyltransferase family 2 protein [Terriglobia bacterium]